MPMVYCQLFSGERLTVTVELVSRLAVRRADEQQHRAASVASGNR